MLSPTSKRTNQKEKNCCQVTFSRRFESNRLLRSTNQVMRATTIFIFITICITDDECNAIFANSHGLDSTGAHLIRFHSRLIFFWIVIFPS